MVRVISVRAVLVAVFGVLGTVGCDDSDKNTGDQVLEGNAGAGGATEPDENGGSDNAGDSGEGADDSGTDDPSAPFYAAEHVVQIEIQLEPGDWDTLRSEGRSLVTAMVDRGYFYEYTYFDADVTIDGERYEDVAIRKKGFLGSISMYRPSLKLDLNRNVAGQSHLGVKKVTLNNNRQDLSNARQCLTYRLYSRAGLPASRCNLARVVVNGEDLGTYTNVEPVDKAMLARHFDDPSGNLYEGQAADFDEATVDHFEMKTNEATNDRSDLERVVQALDRPDDEVVEALAEVVDLDSFRTFWALEALLGHLDSYSGGANNFFTYHDPKSDRFYFFPWGTDTAFDGWASIEPDRDITVYATGRIANRLYGLPAEREEYRQRLGELVEDTWDETELESELDQIAEQAPESSARELGTLRSFVENRAADMTAALAEPARDWVDAAAAEPSACEFMQTDLEVQFSTEWGDLMAATPGQGQFVVDMSMDGNAVETEWFGNAGISTFLGESPQLQMSGPLPDGRLIMFSLTMAPGTVRPGEWPLHGMETYGAIIVTGGSEPGFRLLSYVGDGEVVLEEGSTETGAPIVGTLTAQNLQIECLTP